MEILGYGEDSLTLWALKNRLSEILKKLKDNSTEDECLVFYRPSFGRQGGSNSPQFGEFDFIILSQDTIYLGESKWNYTSLNNKQLIISNNQTIRHEVFEKYLKFWLSKKYTSFDTFLASLVNQLPYGKKIPENKTLLRENFEFVLNQIKSHFGCVKPKINNIFLYLYKEPYEDKINKTNILWNIKHHFIKIDYSPASKGNYIYL